ncbi:helix-turn-helix transcriptional regulator [Paenibacillus segetis]|uniref:HTH cro/C1-type domain-containing protein n=1 Tax=Paenibacillus segetis TaxID=1325360 RepID=A0ABQ1Y8S0_9BACL|nr:helix-turn-helix transcriptional regulator [Paenibacillus segetis]GGH16992.1 hypothetical protein GCM10008013_12140 [Paenibacillus segetis]
MPRTWLIEIRTNANKTHDDIATEVDVSRQYYGMIESGIRNPSVDLAKRIAFILKFDWIIFFEEYGNKTLHIEQSVTSKQKEVG